MGDEKGTQRSRRGVGRRAWAMISGVSLFGIIALALQVLDLVPGYVGLYKTDEGFRGLVDWARLVITAWWPMGVAVLAAASVGLGVWKWWEVLQRHAQGLYVWLLYRLSRPVREGLLVKLRPETGVEAGRLTGRTGGAPTDAPRQSAGEPPIAWHKSANLYWLGYDIASAIHRVERGGAPDEIIHSIRQSWWHAKELGFVQPSIIRKLARMKDEAKAMVEWEWTPDRRAMYVRELYSIVTEVERLAIEHQPDFRSSGPD
jgi:hypothetical protein